MPLFTSLEPHSRSRPEPETDFVGWNEEAVRRYDIDLYYRDAHRLVRWIEARRLAALRRFAGPTGGVRLLEVGCGGGHILQAFGDARRVGLDLSPTMLAKTRRRLGPDVPLLRGDAERLPLADGTFDVVLCTEVLEHTLHPRDVVEELARVAAPHARIVVSVPNERLIDGVKAFLRRVPWLRQLLRRLASEDNDWHLHRMDSESIPAIAAGLVAIERVTAVPFRWLPLRYVGLLRRL